MSELILVRHGQANTQAADEASYDQLSPLGCQQGAWLGDYFRDSGERFDRVIAGSLARHHQTAQAMGFADVTQDARLNEMHYFDLARSVERAFGYPAPQSAVDFARYLPQVITHWSQNELPDVPETFDAFAARVQGVIADLSSQGGRSLVVTSGGVIAMVIRHILQLDARASALIMLRTMNSSVHRVDYVHEHLMLSGFNDVSHLNGAARRHARTFV